VNTIHRVGVVGLGRMGLPMARHLRRAGFAVAGFDRDTVRRRLLDESGGSARTSLRELAADCELILVMVADDAQVLEVCTGPDGIVQHAGPGAVVVISSTVTPSTCRQVGALAAARQIGVLDAPVARGQRAAEEGTLTVFVGGDPALAARCRPVFEAFAREIEHVGDEVGSGQVAKLANNLILWAGVVAVHEALALAEGLGVSPVRLRDALRHGSADGYALRELHLVNLTWPHKDIEQALEVAAQAGRELPLTERVGTLIRSLTREELRRITGTE
jgi:3-hydroxyisobutyrate dehydrogenase-like beta-hydroxyacid dehydrogenase